MIAGFATLNQFDPNAGAFINATGIAGNQAQAINTLTEQLKSTGLWDKLIAIYPFVGGSANTHRFNLKNIADTDAAYRLTFGGTVTHNSNGVTGNGTSGFYNTYINPNTNTSLGQNNISTFVYIRTNVAEDKVDFGNIDTNIGFNFGARSATNTLTSRCNDNTLSSEPTSSTSIGFFGLSRDNSANYVKYYNGTTTTITRTSTTPASRNMLGLAVNNAGSAGFFSSKNHAFCCVGRALNSTDIFNLNNINTQFQVTLGRYVGLIPVEYLLVAGGGGGGGNYGGAGGAGGFISGSYLLSGGTTYTVVVGTGGAGGIGNVQGANGLNSQFDIVTSAIGGGGGGYSSFNTSNIAKTGGSGGGGGAARQVDNKGAGTAGQGNNGGFGGTKATNGTGAGGGGALTAGLNGVDSNSGVGGNGGSGSLWLDGRRYAAGGGGGAFLNATRGGLGGPGGGGNGGYNNGGVQPTAGTPNSGSGGGGASGAGTTQTAASGSTGIFALRYLGTGSIATGGTISYDGTYTYHYFTSAGSSSLITN